MEHLPIRLVGKTEVPTSEGSLLGDIPLRHGCLRQVQQPENFLTGRHAIHGDVEVGTQQPHRQEEIRRQYNDQQALCQGHLPAPILGHREDHSQGSPAVSDEVHDGNGVELHGQHFHGDFSKLLGLPVHLFLLKPVGLIDLQRGQPLEVFQEGIPQRRVLPPVTGQQLFGPTLHRHNGHRNQRDADQQHHRCREADWGQHHKEGHRCQNGIEQLGKIGTKVGL